MFLSGRPVFVESVVKEIQDSHGKAEAAEVDALNESVVTAYKTSPTLLTIMLKFVVGLTSALIILDTQSSFDSTLSIQQGNETTLHHAF